MSLNYYNVFVNQENHATLPNYNYQQKILIPREIEGSKLHLKICNIIEEVYYTGIHTVVKVVVVNTITGDVDNCAEAIEVEVVVLEEDFEFEDDQEWSPEYFSGKIVVGKDGRGLLRGVNRRVLLKEGVGFVEVSFKHSSLWFGKCRYRFGARTVGYHTGTRIREAKTEAFWVKDRRCMRKREKALLLTDKIWKIEGIGKNGRLAGLLKKTNIVTVKDFLVEHNLYRDRLKQIFEEHKFANKFEATCKHALSCELDEKKYLYPSPETGQTSTVFNSVGELLGMMLKGNQYVSIEEISEADKVFGQQLVAIAFQNWNAVEVIPHRSIFDTGNSCSNSFKRRRISARDQVVERAITDDNLGEGDGNGPRIDSLPPDITSAYYIPALPDNILNGTDYINDIHDQPWFSPSEVESFLLYDAIYKNG